MVKNMNIQTQHHNKRRRKGKVSAKEWRNMFIFLSVGIVFYMIACGLTEYYIPEPVMIADWLPISVKQGVYFGIPFILGTIAVAIGIKSKMDIP